MYVIFEVILAKIIPYISRCFIVINIVIKYIIDAIINGLINPLVLLFKV